MFESGAKKRVKSRAGIQLICALMLPKPVLTKISERTSNFQVQKNLVFFGETRLFQITYKKVGFGLARYICNLK